MVSHWENFYVIVGSCGGALIGLQFVVMTLIADKRHSTDAATLAAFGTPTVVHLTGSLVVSALMSVPWPSASPLSAALGLCGLSGLVYSVIVVRRARRQTGGSSSREPSSRRSRTTSSGGLAATATAA